MKIIAFWPICAPGMIWDQLEKAGVPGVCGVWSPPEGGNRLDDRRGAEDSICRPC